MPKCTLLLSTIDAQFLGSCQTGLADNPHRNNQIGCAFDFAEIINLLFKKGEIKRSQEGFYGNLGRREMRDNF